MVTPTAAEPSTRKRPGKAVLIRLAIYVPLLSFFGWQAVDRALSERDAADAAFREDMSVWLESPPGLVDLTHAIPIDAEAVLSAPPETGDDTTGSAGETGTTGTTSETSTTGETGDDTSGSTSETSSTGTSGETGDALELEPDAGSTSSSTSTTTGP
ncbi:hypothetical protein ACNOYE_09635 [Nannocystaceae bacterium ST9]